MRNQVLKTTTMIGVLIILSAVSGRAQAGANFTAVVPFDFSVSGRILPAGEYIVARSTAGSHEGLVIRAKDGTSGIYLLTKSIQTEDNQKNSSLVFKQYGDQYFLSQVWISGRKTGRELFKSRQERALERDLAQRGIKPETIAVDDRAK